MIKNNNLTKEWWLVYNDSDEQSIVYGNKGGSAQVSSTRTFFKEFDTEEELANYLYILTGDENWYWDRKPKEEENELL